MIDRTEEATMDFTHDPYDAEWETGANLATVHRASDDDETYCELCDSDVVYSGPDDRHGRCGCDEAA